MRAIRPEDTAALYPTFADTVHCRYLSEPAFVNEEALAAWLFEPGWPGRTWIAVDRVTSAIAGRFVAVPRDAGAGEGRVEEIGYVVVAEHQGQGVARECAEALVRHLFEVDGCAALSAEVDAENVASIRLLERLGFTRIAFHREHEITHEGVRDVCDYRFTQREWTKRAEV